MKATIQLFIGLAFILISLLSNAKTTVSTPANANSTWSSVSWTPFSPSCNTDIILNGNISVTSTVDLSSCSTPIVITINGTLNFPNNGVRILLPTNSTVIINSGGRITKSFPGGGNSTFIESGSTILWAASDGTVNGPTILGTPLPVELISFTATLVSSRSSVMLNWSTASEINNHYFELQKSVNGTSWNVIGTIKGTGTSKNIVQYEFLDNEPNQGTSYYRLKQVDFDGQFNYSSVISNTYYTTLSVSVYPNPTQNLLYIKHFNNDESAFQAKIISLQGIDYTNQINQSVIDESIVMFDISTLNSGTYILKMGSSNISIQKY